jgi:hypothetical protein
MIELPSPTETRIIQAARDSGLTIATFLDRLLEQYQLDRQEIEQAEASLKEEGGISLEDFRVKHGV